MATVASAAARLTLSLFAALSVTDFVTRFVSVSSHFSASSGVIFQRLLLSRIAISLPFFIAFMTEVRPQPTFWATAAGVMCLSNAFFMSATLAPPLTYVKLCHKEYR